MNGDIDVLSYEYVSEGWLLFILDNVTIPVYI